MPWPDFDTSLIVLTIVTFVAGLVRGFSGFGTSMIVVPVAAALYNPIWALLILLVIDIVPAIPVTLPALRQARWQEAAPLLLGVVIFIPLGVWILTNTDPTTVRWMVFAFVLILVLLMIAGWAYRGTRNHATSFSVGIVSGIFGGIAGIYAPPALMYWLSSGEPARTIRANMLVLLFFADIAVATNLWLSGYFKLSVTLIGILAAPTYFLGLTLGARMFGLASEQSYRRIALGLVLLAAIGSMPALDSILRP